MFARLNVFPPFWATMAVCAWSPNGDSKKSGDESGGEAVAGAPPASNAFGELVGSLRRGAPCHATGSTGEAPTWPSCGISFATCNRPEATEVACAVEGSFGRAWCDGGFALPKTSLTGWVGTWVVDGADEPAEGWAVEVSREFTCAGEVTFALRRHFKSQPGRWG